MTPVDKFDLLKSDTDTSSKTGILSNTDRKITRADIIKTGDNVEAWRTGKDYEDIRNQHNAEVALLQEQLVLAKSSEKAEQILIDARKENLKVEGGKAGVKAEMKAINDLTGNTDTGIEGTLIQALMAIGKISKENLGKIATTLGVGTTSLAGVIDTCNDCGASFDIATVEAVGKLQFFAFEQYMKEVEEIYKSQGKYKIDRSAGLATFKTINKILTEDKKIKDSAVKPEDENKNQNKEKNEKEETMVAWAPSIEDEADKSAAFNTRYANRVKVDANEHTKVKILYAEVMPLGLADRKIKMGQESDATLLALQDALSYKISGLKKGKGENFTSPDIEKLREINQNITNIMNERINPTVLEKLKELKKYTTTSKEFNLGEPDATSMQIAIKNNGGAGDIVGYLEFSPDGTILTTTTFDAFDTKQKYKVEYSADKVIKFTKVEVADKNPTLYNAINAYTTSSKEFTLGKTIDTDAKTRTVMDMKGIKQVGKINFNADGSLASDNKIVDGNKEYRIVVVNKNIQFLSAEVVAGDPEILKALRLFTTDSKKFKFGNYDADKMTIQLLTTDGKDVGKLEFTDKGQKLKTDILEIGDPKEVYKVVSINKKIEFLKSIGSLLPEYDSQFADKDPSGPGSITGYTLEGLDKGPDYAAKVKVLASGYITINGTKLGELMIKDATKFDIYEKEDKKFALLATVSVPTMGGELEEKTLSFTFDAVENKDFGNRVEFRFEKTDDSFKVGKFMEYDIFVPTEATTNAKSEEVPGTPEKQVNISTMFNREKTIKNMKEEMKYTLEKNIDVAKFPNLGFLNSVSMSEQLDVKKTGAEGFTRIDDAGLSTPEECANIEKFSKKVFINYEGDYKELGRLVFDKDGAVDMEASKNIVSKFYGIDLSPEFKPQAADKKVKMEITQPKLKELDTQITNQKERITNSTTLPVNIDLSILPGFAREWIHNSANIRLYPLRDLYACSVLGEKIDDKGKPIAQDKRTNLYFKFAGDWKNDATMTPPMLTNYLGENTDGKCAVVVPDTKKNKKNISRYFEVTLAGGQLTPKEVKETLTPEDLPTVEGPVHLTKDNTNTKYSGTNLEYYNAAGLLVTNIACKSPSGKELMWKLLDQSTNIVALDLFDASKVTGSNSISQTDKETIFTSLLTEKIGIDVRKSTIRALTQEKGKPDKYVYYKIEENNKGAFVVEKDTELTEAADEIMEKMNNDLAIVEKLNTASLRLYEKLTKKEKNLSITSGLGGIGVCDLMRGDIKTFLESKDDARSLTIILGRDETLPSTPAKQDKLTLIPVENKIKFSVKGDNITLDETSTSVTVGKTKYDLEYDAKENKFLFKEGKPAKTEGIITEGAGTTSVDNGGKKEKTNVIDTNGTGGNGTVGGTKVEGNGTVGGDNQEKVKVEGAGTVGGDNQEKVKVEGAGTVSGDNQEKVKVEGDNDEKVKKAGKDPSVDEELVLPEAGVAAGAEYTDLDEAVKNKERDLIIASTKGFIKERTTKLEQLPTNVDKEFQTKLIIQVGTVKKLVEYLENLQRIDDNNGSYTFDKATKKENKKLEKRNEEILNDNNVGGSDRKEIDKEDNVSRGIGRKAKRIDGLLNNIKLEKGKEGTK